MDLPSLPSLIGIDEREESSLLSSFLTFFLLSSCISSRFFTLASPLSKQLLHYPPSTPAMANVAPTSSSCNYTAQICGNLSIPYPFGMTPECGLADYRITCINNIPYVKTDYIDLQVLSFSSDHLILSSTLLKANSCGEDTTKQISLVSQSGMSVSPDNIFLVSGCGLSGAFGTSPAVYIVGKFYGSCNNPCYLDPGVFCTVQMPKIGAKQINFNVSAGNTPCGFSTILNDHDLYKHQGINSSDEFSYKLKISFGLQLPYNSTYNCSNLETKLDYACAPNSQCLDVPNIVLAPDNDATTGGYVCNCTKGYRGDGYRNGKQCQDIDECSEGLDNCVKDPLYRNCTNTPGSFVCGCLNGAEGNGIDMHSPLGTGCILKAIVPTTSTRTSNNQILTATGAFTCAGGLVLMGLLLRWLWLKWKAKEQKAAYFKINGGMKLQEYISKAAAAVGVGQNFRAPKLFSENELKTATEDFASHRKIGAGGHGTVFRGRLKDGTEVAIKKSFNLQYGEDLKEQFVNEVIILSQINHRNIVQVLGCCLETQTPLLVYEYVCNGTLYELLHSTYDPDDQEAARAKGSDQASFADASMVARCAAQIFNWESRLTLAVECADALAYLHSSLSTPIFHRDIKSSNILLDRTFTPKIADFGISRLVPRNKTHISTLFQGTLGYLDPEYLKTSRLTDKSDVYSFGVFLMELITCLSPNMDPDRLWAEGMPTSDKTAVAAAADNDDYDGGDHDDDGHSDMIRHPIRSHNVINTGIKHPIELDDEIKQAMKPISPLAAVPITALCVSSLENGHFADLIDPRLLEVEESVEGRLKSIYRTAKLAAACVQMPGCNRPSMKQVHLELLWIRGSMHHHSPRKVGGDNGDRNF